MDRAKHTYTHTHELHAFTTTNHGNITNPPKKSRHTPQARSLFYQVCKALDYLHERPILHRDLSWGNIMFTHDAQGRMLAKV